MKTQSYKRRRAESELGFALFIAALFIILLWGASGQARISGSEVEPSCKGGRCATMNNPIQIEFYVKGLPKPAGSKKAFALKKGGQYTGSVAVTDAAGKPGKDWRTNVSAHAKIERNRQEELGNFGLLNVPLLLCLTFYMPRPASHHVAGKKDRPLKPNAPKYHTIAPDATKLTRSVEDALTKVLYVDDALIVAQSIQKRYCDEQYPEPGVLVWVGVHTE